MLIFRECVNSPDVSNTLRRTDILGKFSAISTREPSLLFHISVLYTKPLYKVIKSISKRFASWRGNLPFQISPKFTKKKTFFVSLSTFLNYSVTLPSSGPSKYVMASRVATGFLTSLSGIEVITVTLTTSIRKRFALAIILVPIPFSKGCPTRSWKRRSHTNIGWWRYAVVSSTFLKTSGFSFKVVPVAIATAVYKFLAFAFGLVPVPSLEIRSASSCMF